LAPGNNVSAIRRSFSSFGQSRGLRRARTGAAVNLRHAGIKLEVIGNHDTLQPDVFSSRRLAFSSAKV